MYFLIIYAKEEIVKSFKSIKEHLIIQFVKITKTDDTWFLLKRNNILHQCLLFWKKKKISLGKKKHMVKTVIFTWKYVFRNRSV